MLKIATRGSRLALAQAQAVQHQLAQAGVEAELCVISTRGDRALDLQLADNLDKGLFTSEVEATVVSGETDLAVHSQKDMPTTYHQACAPPIVFQRVAVEDLLLVRRDRVHEGDVLPLAPGALVATSSARREALLRHHRPDLKVMPIRGNVPTRINKVCQGSADALVLARAGLHRLGLHLNDMALFRLHPQHWLPAPGQGAIALQARQDRSDLLELLHRLSDPDAGQAVALERQMLERAGGGCHVALGAWAQRDEAGLWQLHVGHGDDKGWRSAQASGAVDTLADTVHQNLMAATVSQAAQNVCSALNGAP